MGNVPTLTPLHEAVTELELAAALVLLAEQESTPIGHALPRLRGALSAVHFARALASELATSTGRPPLTVLDGGCVRVSGSPGAA
jgi:hypothetical protein